MDAPSWPQDRPDKGIAPQDRLIVALDVPDHRRAWQLVDTLGDAVTFYKVGLELAMAGSWRELVDGLVARGKKVFLDLKFFDVPVTVRAAVARAAGSGATFCTVHGNTPMLAAACEAKGGIGVLAVTALTSLDRSDLEDLGFGVDVHELVLSRARRALEVGCDGVVSSGLEAPQLRTELGGRFLVVTPGIRPVDNDDAGDQKRVVTPQQALRGGADYVVVGRPIRDAPDPRARAEEIQAGIAAALAAA